MSKIIEKIEPEIVSAIKLAHDNGWRITSGAFGNFCDKTACALTALVLAKQIPSSLHPCDIMQPLFKYYRISEACARYFINGFDGQFISDLSKIREAYRAWFNLGQRMRQFVAENGFDKSPPPILFSDVFGVPAIAEKVFGLAQVAV